MKFSDYQRDAARTLTNAPERAERTLSVSAMGLAGESGEVVELLKKHIGHGHDLDRVKLQKELGDVLWYVAAVATLCGIDLDAAAAGNIEKLKVRFPNGFTSADSKARRDVSPDIYNVEGDR